MNSNQIGILLIAVIVIGLAGVGWRLVSTVETEEQELTGVGTLTRDAIDRVVLQDVESQATIVKSTEGDEWTINAFPVVADALDAMWETAEKFNGAGLVAINSGSHNRMGVSEQTGTRVQFFSGEAMVEDFYIGDKTRVSAGEQEYQPWSTFVAHCFLRRPGDENVYGVFCGSPDRFSADISDWGQRLLYDIPLQQVGPMTFSYADDSFTLSVIDSNWTITSDGREPEPAESEIARQILTSLRRIEANRLPNLDEAAGVDFTNPEVVVQVETSATSEIEAKTILFVPAGNEEGEYYVKEASEPYVYVINDFKAERILVDREGLREKEEEEAEATPTPAPGG